MKKERTELAVGTGEAGHSRAVPGPPPGEGNVPWGAAEPCPRGPFPQGLAWGRAAGS